MKFIWIFLLALGLSACGSKTQTENTGTDTETSGDVANSSTNDNPSSPTSATAADDRAALPEGWEERRDEKYSIYYPKTWEMQNPDQLKDLEGMENVAQMGAQFILFSESEGKNDIFRENVNLMIQNLGGQSIDLAEYTRISEKQIKEIISNSEILESVTVESGSFPYQKLVYTGLQAETPLKWLQYYWVAKGNAFVLTLTTEAKKYDSFMGVGKQIMDSFRVL